MRRHHPPLPSPRTNATDPRGTLKIHARWPGAAHAKSTEPSTTCAHGYHANDRFPEYRWCSQCLWAEQRFQGRHA